MPKRCLRLLITEIYRSLFTIRGWRKNWELSLIHILPDTGGVYLVPAFTGLGAPYWDMYARGTLVGMTRGTSRAHIVRATLEAIAYQSRDVLEAMRRDSGMPLSILRVDGGASANNMLMQFQSDILSLPVERPSCIETTAQGAAFLAGLASGVFPSREAIGQGRETQRRFTPDMEPAECERLYRGWQRALERCRGCLLYTSRCV